MGGPVKISIESGMTHGMGFPVFNFRASSELDDAAIGEDLRKIAFERAHLPQYWYHGEDLNMVLYRERDTNVFGSVEITILTKAVGDDIEYNGTIPSRYTMPAVTTGKAARSPIPARFPAEPNESLRIAARALGDLGAAQAVAFETGYHRAEVGLRHPGKIPRASRGEAHV